MQVVPVYDNYGCKRGDIGSTSAAYADAWLGEDAAFYCDALAVNPFLGLDTLEPFMKKLYEEIMVYLFFLRLVILVLPIYRNYVTKISQFTNI